jgi:hypothetical protein
MPTFYSEEIELDPDDFLSACNSYEINELIKALIEDGHINDPYVKRKDNVSMNEESFNECLDKITNNYLQLTHEEEEVIRNIAKRLP